MKLEKLLRVHWNGNVKIVNKKTQTESGCIPAGMMYCLLDDSELEATVRKINICQAKCIEETQIVKRDYLEVTI